MSLAGGAVAARLREPHTRPRACPLHTHTDRVQAHSQGSVYSRRVSEIQRIMLRCVCTHTYWLKKRSPKQTKTVKTEKT